MNMREYCENNAIFFYVREKVEKRLIPKRKDSSRVTLNGLARHRGSMLDLLYSVPNLKEIQLALDQSQGESALNHNNFVKASHRNSSDQKNNGSDGRNNEE